MRKLRLLVAVAVLLSPVSLLADDSDWRSWPMGERLKLSVGIFEPDIDTEASITQLEPLIPGDLVDFEDDLGLDDSESAAFASLNWRFFKRHSLNFKYYSLDRDGDATLSEEFSFDGETFPVDYETETTFDLIVYEVSYSYSLLFDEKKNLYLGLGISGHDMEFKIVGVDPDFSDMTVEVDQDFIAPLPTINLGFEYAITDKWLINLTGGYMDVDFDSGDDRFDGKILIGDAGIRWKALQHLGFGLHYSYFELDGEFEDDDILAEVDLEYKGPRLSIDLYF